MEKDKDKTKTTSDNIRSITPELRLKHCSKRASRFSFNTQYSIAKYCRSGKEMLKQANVYKKEGDLEMEYILSLRYILLILELIPSHPEYNRLNVSEKENIKQSAKEELTKTEQLKPRLLDFFKKENLKYLQEVEQEKQKLKEQEEARNKVIAPEINVPQIAKATSTATNDALIAADELKLKTKVFSPKNTVAPKLNELPQSSKERKVPIVDRSTKPAYLKLNDRLRDIVVPKKLMHHFLHLASSNTYNNVETCGILAGKLERNRLLVSHVLIPKQTGAPDSCITYNEEDIFDFQDQNDLITLGWIHTHPSQTAFLSSVDLHTHCSYQLMMAEAIAIVCAPKYNETGFFHLTPDYGLNYIANCRETGFHPHPIEPPLFTAAKHFILDNQASIAAIDLRTK